ncbi:MAG: metal ABC transporter substrate-binding protein [Candidatus Zixiibacteriota bacterium]
MSYVKYTLVLVIAACLFGAHVEAKVRVVASTSDLAYFAKAIGVEHVEVSSIASPTADVHYIEVRPSYMVKVKKADVVLKVGMELDLWMDRIIDGSRNSKLQIVDCSKYIEPVEVPTFKADARYGDLHRYGNPHYWLGPQNVAPVTQAILEGLSAADPEHARQFEQNRDAFLSELEEQLEPLRQKTAQLEGAEVVFYHNSWPYFNEFVGVVAAGFVEPYPGVAPSPSHVAEITELVQGRGIKVIAVEPYFDMRVPKTIASKTGAKVITLYPSLGGREKKETYLEWLEGNIDALLKTLQ